MFARKCKPFVAAGGAEYPSIDADSVTVAKDTSENTTSHTLTLPAADENRRMVVVGAVRYNSGDRYVSSYTSGWSELFIGTTGGNPCTLFALHKLSGVANTLELTLNGTSRIQAYAFYVDDAGDPADWGSDWWASNSYSTTTQPPTLDMVTTEKRLWLGFGHINTSAPTDYSDAGWTEFLNSADTRYFLGRYLAANSDEQTPGYWTHANTNVRAAMTIAIGPPS